MQSNTVTILGFPVNVFASPEDATEHIRWRISSSKKTFCAAANPEKLYRARRDPRLRDILLSADIRICDGVGLSIAAKLLYGERVPRCTGVDLFLTLAALAETEGWRIFLLGASPESNEGARRELGRRFPQLRIAGARHGFFSDSNQVVDEINASGAHLLFVAMGSPRQELWITEHRDALHTPFCMGVGGSLDVLAGTVKRAPALFRKTGTEWLFRLFSDPRRARRQVALPLFALDVLKASFHDSSHR